VLRLDGAGARAASEGPAVGSILSSPFGDRSRFDAFWRFIAGFRLFHAAAIILDIVCNIILQRGLQNDGNKNRNPNLGP
jgi:hypothetical protein